MLVLLIVLYFIMPVGIIYLCQKTRWASKVGGVVLAYAIGLVIGHIGIIPSPSGYVLGELQAHHNNTAHLLEKLNVFEWKGSDVLYLKMLHWQDQLTALTIALAIPLLLFSLHVRKWFSMAGNAIKSLLLAVLSVSLIVVLVFIFYHPEDEKPWKIAGMLVGLYTGGTPNLASLKLMLDVNPSTYIRVHTYDMVVSFVYLLFLMTVGKWVFRFFLPARYNRLSDAGESTVAQVENYDGMLSPKNLRGMGIALLAAVGILLIALFVSSLVPETAQTVVAVLCITTIGILFSFNKKINQWPKTFELGMYFILVFSIIVASMVNLKTLNILNEGLFGVIALVVFGSLLIHALLSKLFKIDADTVMITSTAFICSPPFVPMVASALKNKQIIVSGLTIGIIGYAMGNYLGYIISIIIKNIL